MNCDRCLLVPLSLQVWEGGEGLQRKRWYESCPVKKRLNRPHGRLHRPDGRLVMGGSADPVIPRGRLRQLCRPGRRLRRSQAHTSIRRLAERTPRCAGALTLAASRVARASAPFGQAKQLPSHQEPQGRPPYQVPSPQVDGAAAGVPLALARERPSPILRIHRRRRRACVPMGGGLVQGVMGRRQKCGEAGWEVPRRDCTARMLRHRRSG